MSKILSLSHIDMDGVSAQIMLYKAFRDVTILNCGYDKVHTYLEVMCDSLTRSDRFDSVYVTDLHFSEENFIELHRITNQHPNTQFIYIDHHDYTFDYSMYSTPNLKVIVSKMYSATKLTYGYLKKHHGLQETKELRDFVDDVDAYDLWRMNDENFQDGLVYNELFWDMGIKRFYLRYKDEQSLRNSDYNKYNRWMEEKNKYFNKLNEKGMLFLASNKSIFCGFIDEFRSHITLDFPEYLVHINVTRYGSISVRIGKSLGDERAKYVKDRLVTWLESLPIIHSAGGHINAMGAKAVNYTASDLVKIGQELTVLTDRILEHELNLYSGTGEMTF